MAHIHEKIDFVSNVFIVNKGSVLLRIHDKYGFWLPVGGHVELDEDPAEAAVREAKEEAGLDVTLIGGSLVETGNGLYVKKEGRDILVPTFINRHFVNDVHEHISFEYFGVSESRDIKPGVGEKQDGFKWFTREELEETEYDIAETIKRYACAALETVNNL